MSAGAETDLKTIAADFRAWAAGYLTTERTSLWECDYARWPKLWAALEAFLQSSDPARWNASVVDTMIFLLARDNEMETLKGFLVARPGHLLALAREGLGSAERDARWQLADGLGSVAGFDDQVGPLLAAYAADPDEYVSRRALLALGRRRAKDAEAFAIRAWNTGHEYQRMAALAVLSNLDSTFLPSYLERAAEDGRPFLLAEAERIQTRQ